MLPNCSTVSNLGGLFLGILRFQSAVKQHLSRVRLTAVARRRKVYLCWQSETTLNFRVSILDIAVSSHRIMWLMNKPPSECLVGYFMFV